MVSQAEAGASMFEMLGTMSYTGLPRLYFALGGSFDFSTLPPNERKEMEQAWSSAKSLNTMVAELKQTKSIYEEAQTLPITLTPLPVLIISASEPINDSWSDMQKDLARLSKNVTIETIDNTTHMSLVYDRVAAEAVARTIRTFVEED